MAHTNELPESHYETILRCQFEEKAKVMGYPIAAIKSCRQFKRAHNFISDVPSIKL